MADRDLEGTLRLAGAPAAAQRVLAYDRPGGRLLAAVDSDASGTFRLSVPGEIDRTTVLARFRGDGYGAVAREVGLPAAEPVALELPGPLPAVRVTLRGGPGRVVVFAEPTSLTGIPDELVPFLDQYGPGVFDSRFLEREVRGDEVTLRLAPGTWRLGAYLATDEPARLDSEPEAWAAEQAFDDETGAELPGDRHAGFAVDVGRDRHVALTLSRH
jgi:hypothetical protein